uniref:Uncharacterized protein n=1 Tax=Oryza sativa subsp. japonica TaxID=39947 RepID=Q7EY35_ORYSJ|nr:hypothetical protein [Oryza sativa Japonica Group]
MLGAAPTPPRCASLFSPSTRCSRAAFRPPPSPRPASSRTCRIPLRARRHACAWGERETRGREMRRDREEKKSREKKNKRSGTLSSGPHITLLSLLIPSNASTATGPHCGKFLFNPPLNQHNRFNVGPTTPSFINTARRRGIYV